MLDDLEVILKNRTQQTEHIENILRIVTINHENAHSNESINRRGSMNHAAYPFWTCDTDAPTEKVIIDEESGDESVPDEDERQSLQVTDDGWYVAAPTVRKNYRKKIEDVEGTEEENPRHAAKTARVRGLVVREYVPPAPRTVSRSNNGNKKDFKRFRKNHVIRGFTTFNSNGQTNHRTVRLVAVLPKESERQRELEMKQQELDREQAYADALFNDNGATGKKGRRSGGGIMGMLSQPKRGRTKC